MLPKEEFVRRVLGEAPAELASVPQDSQMPVGFDTLEALDNSVDTRFAQLLLESCFGPGGSTPRSSVIRSKDAVARCIPEHVVYWPKTSTRPHQTILIEADLTHRELLDIPAFKSQKLSHLDIAEDALARLVAEVLEGYQRGNEGLEASALKGAKSETLCVVSIVDERAGHSGRLACFGTFNRETGGLETFFLTEHARIWDRADARDRLGLLYERQFSKLGGQSWQEAFTTSDERKLSNDLLEVCTREVVAETDLQKSILDLLDTIANGFGLGKKKKAGRRLQAFVLPGDHDIGIDPEDRDTDFSGVNPFRGVTLRDDRNRLLGYIVYPLTKKTDAERLRQHLSKHNRFHNVLVVYPDANQATFELWQGKDQLTGKLRKGQAHTDAADVVNLLSRFFVVSRAKVRNPPELAQELAYRARYLRRLVLKQLIDEPERGAIRDLYKSFKDALVHDQNEDEFADAFAQTITYGLLTARWIGNDRLSLGTERFTRQSALKYLPAASSFLNELFQSALSINFDEQMGRLLWLVDDIADLLDRVDVNYIFGAGDLGSESSTDPVIHFYEPFLAAYDNELKNKRGVYFTPNPVVSYIVRSVHELLKSEFGLEDGLASRDTWGEVATRIEDLVVPKGISKNEPFVNILDPATGTGTFLYECIEVIESTMKDRWCKELDTNDWGDERVASRWRAYVVADLLPRVYGYEIMMASYAIAHLKLSFKLAETGFELSSSIRLNIYLTNSLESPTKIQNEFDGISPALAAEANSVANVKLNKYFTVVLGNPPYANYSANLSSESRAIVDKYRSFSGSPIRERNQLQFERNLQDDFVKFISLGDELICRAGVGMLGYITNATMLASPSLRGMREYLLGHFDDLYELHLHGGVNEIGAHAEHDQNVFDIAQAVGIHLYARRPKRGAQFIRFAELWGPRPQKYSFLVDHSVPSTEWVEVIPDDENCAFMPQEAGTDTLVMVRLDGVFAKFGAGIKTNRDSVAIAFSETELLDQMRSFNPELAAQARECVQPILYRPFDQRFVFYHPGAVASRSLPTMSHILAGANVGLLASSSWTSADRFSVNVSRLMVEMKTGTHDRGTSFFPLYRYEKILDGPLLRSDNFTEEFRQKWQRLTRKPLGAEDAPFSKGGGPDEVFHWIYGLCHSQEYRRRHQALLAQGFPIVLFPRNPSFFAEVVALGRSIAALHLLDESVNIALIPFVGEVDADVQKITYAHGSVWIDKKLTRGFVGVSQEVWDFRIGGYPVCEKWLKDRKGRRLSKVEIDHFRRVLVILGETLALMEKVDAVIKEHGGWPDAFVAKQVATQ
jgi:hypothetical protein